MVSSMIVVMFLPVVILLLLNYYYYYKCLISDELRDGWAFRVGTWNVESLTGRSGELVEALGERRIDIACAGNSVER